MPARKIEIFADAGVADTIQAVAENKDVLSCSITTTEDGQCVAHLVVGGGDRQGIRAVVSESTFFSYRSIVRDKIGTIPVLSLLKTPLSYLLVGNSLSPADYVDHIAPIPLLIIHGSADPIIPSHHAEWLLAKAKEPKTLWLIPGGGHTGAFVDPASPYRKRLIDFLQEALSR